MDFDIVYDLNGARNLEGILIERIPILHDAGIDKETNPLGEIITAKFNKIAGSGSGLFPLFTSSLFLINIDLSFIGNGYFVSCIVQSAEGRIPLPKDVTIKFKFSNNKEVFLNFENDILADIVSSGSCPINENDLDIFLNNYIETYSIIFDNSIELKDGFRSDSIFIEKREWQYTFRLMAHMLKNAVK